MSYVTINSTNVYDPDNQRRYATQQEADARAHEILSVYPNAKVYTAQVLADYTAVVTVSSSAPEEPGAPEEPVI